MMAFLNFNLGHLNLICQFGSVECKSRWLRADGLLLTAFLLSTSHQSWQFLSIIQLYECVNSTSLSLCLCLHTEFSLCLCHSVYHHKWADAQFFMVDVQFFGADAQFFRADAQFFAAGLLWPRSYAFCCCWTTFVLEIMVLWHVYPLLSMCKLCLPLTEHVQTLYWACAEIIYIIYPVFDSFDW